MARRILVFGPVMLLALAVFAFACGDDDGEGTEESGATEYDVSVQFNESATQDNTFEVGDFLRGFDDDLDYGIMEIFPPIGRGLLATDASDFCQTVAAELEAKSYVDSVTCGPPPAAGELDDGDETVTITNVPRMGSIAPDTFLTFEGASYRAVDIIQASLVAEDEFQQIGVATEADIDFEGELKVFRRQGDDAGIYTFSPPIEVEGEEGDVPALWLGWTPEQSGGEPQSQGEPQVDPTPIRSDEGIEALRLDGVWVFQHQPEISGDALHSGTPEIVDGCLVVGNTIVVWHFDRIDEADEAIAAVRAGESPQLLIGGSGISVDEGAGPDQIPTIITDRCPSSSSAVWFDSGAP